MSDQTMSNNERKLVVFDRDFENMLISAERYACGRRTYIVKATVDYIMRFVEDISTNTLLVMLGDFVQKHRDEMRGFEQGITEWKPWGDDCDKKEWLRLEIALMNERDKRTEKAMS